MFVITLYDLDGNIQKQYLCNSFDTLYDYFKKNRDMFLSYMCKYDFTVEFTKLRGAKYIGSD